MRTFMATIQVSLENIYKIVDVNANRSNNDRPKINLPDKLSTITELTNFESKLRNNVNNFKTDIVSMDV